MIYKERCMDRPVYGFTSVYNLSDLNPGLKVDLVRKRFTKLGSCILWGAATDASADISVDTSVDTLSSISQYWI